MSPAWSARRSPPAPRGCGRARGELGGGGSGAPSPRRRCLSMSQHSGGRSARRGRHGPWRGLRVALGREGRGVPGSPWLPRGVLSPLESDGRASSGAGSSYHWQSQEGDVLHVRPWWGSPLLSVPRCPVEPLLGLGRALGRCWRKRSCVEVSLFLS